MMCGGSTPVIGRCHWSKLGCVHAASVDLIVSCNTPKLSRPLV